ncbi:MAG: DUF2061 domain-containing protein [Gammaproteobacteria bacterium]|nr:DUF2061 domain-containing protein [Gammaproteobacteria bacterium]
MEQVSTINSTNSASDITRERPARSLLKAVSWRVTGSLDTILLSWIFTQQLAVAIAIGTTEVVTKIVLYYLHERIWSRVAFGRI